MSSFTSLYMDQPTEILDRIVEILSISKITYIEVALRQYNGVDNVFFFMSYWLSSSEGNESKALPGNDFRVLKFHFSKSS